jgi:hypothetical protein
MNTGSGKTAVIQALAKELGIELVGWENPVESISYHDKNRRVFTDLYLWHLFYLQIQMLYKLAKVRRQPDSVFC